MNTEDDWKAEAYYERQERMAQRCQCGNPDWPGQCPGPANCPCCERQPVYSANQADDDDEAAA